MSLSVDDNQAPGQATIRVVGSFNYDAVLEFRDAYAQEDWANTKLTVDLGQCDYIDSAALGALLLMKSALDKAEGEVVIRVGHDAVRESLGAVHFEKKFTVE